MKITNTDYISDEDLVENLAALEVGDLNALHQLLVGIGGSANLSSFRFTDPSLNFSGGSLLRWTVCNHQPNAAEWLLEVGFDVNAIEMDLYHTLAIVMSRASEPTTDYKKWRAIALSMIHHPNITMDTLDPTITYVDSNGYSHTYHINGNSPLQSAIVDGNIHGDFRLLDALVAKGINVNIGIACKWTSPPWIVVSTPLFIAIQAGNTVLVDHLIRLGAAVSGEPYYPVIIGKDPYPTAMDYLEYYKEIISSHNYAGISACLRRAEEQMLLTSCNNSSEQRAAESQRTETDSIPQISIFPTSLVLCARL